MYTKLEPTRLRELMRQSPYFMIAFALNTTLIALATVWKLSESHKTPLTEAQIAALTSKPEEPKNTPPPEDKDLFDGKDAPVDDGDFDVPEDVPELVPVNQNAKFSDHPETNDDQPFDEVSGSDMNSRLLGAKGINPFDSIGVGGGSDRGGRRGWGNGRGGNEDLVVKRRHDRIGSTRRTELAVEAGLRWLARHQSPDGSWLPDGFTKQCQGGTVCEHSVNYGYSEYQSGVTGLALLAFLGAGYDFRSEKVFDDPITHTKIRAGEVVRKGILWLKDHQDEAGSLVEQSNHKWGYNHAIATLALCEAYALSRVPQFKQPAQAAVSCLIAGQNVAPGGTGLWAWRYRPQCGDNDTSVTGWAVMALKSAEMAGLRIAQDSLEGAYAFCAESTDRTSGHLGYLSRADAGTQVKSSKNADYQNHPALAAVGMCIRTFVRHDVNDPTLEAGAKLLSRDLPAWDKQKKSNDFYYWYYGSLALNQYDGPESPRPGKGQYWREWEAALKKALLDNQTNNPKLCSDGSWDGDDRWGVDGGGRVFATAINTLTFEVYYRYGNAFGTVKKAPAAKK